MQRVIVIGCPGSGKSVFSRALHAATGLPLVHLDQLYWNADRSEKPKAVFLQGLEQALRQEAWIIDGNYASTMERRLLLADTVFFLDYPTALCVEGIRKRRGQKRADLPWIEPEGEPDADFLAFVERYRAESRPQVLELLGRYPEKGLHIFESRTEAAAFLATLSGNSL